MEKKVNSIRVEDLDPRQAYRLMISVVIPRPIAWVSTIGADGKLNLAPFSFFNGVGEFPPTVMFSVGRREGREKDTLRNVLETGEFVVNIVSENLAEAMVKTSGDWSYEVDEFKIAGLETAPSVEVKPPRVKAAPVAMEARVIQTVPVNETHHTIVLGRILRFHIQSDLLGSDGLVDAGRLRPIARLGGKEYTRLGTIFKLERPRT